MKSSPHLELRFEKILDRAVERGFTNLDVIGVDSTLVAALFLSEIQNPDLAEGPRLVVVADDREASLLAQHLRFFDKDLPISVLHGFDVSPYSGLYPNARRVSSRVRWIYFAQNPEPRQVFIATVDGLMQKTMPLQVLKKTARRFRKGQDLPTGLARYLSGLGFQSVPVVEDEGSYAVRGGIVDIFSPAHHRPVRIELFGDTIETLRFFDPETQRSEGLLEEFTLLPPREILYTDESRERAALHFRESLEGREVEKQERDEVLQGLTQGQLFPGVDFLLADFYKDACSPLTHFSAKNLGLWLLNPLSLERAADLLLEARKKEFGESDSICLRPSYETLYVPFTEALETANATLTLNLSKVDVQDNPLATEESERRIPVPTLGLKFHQNASQSATAVIDELIKKIRDWRSSGFIVFVATGTHAQSQRLSALFERTDLQARAVAQDEFSFAKWFEEQDENAQLVHLIPRPLGESLRLGDERLIFLRDDDFFGKKQHRRAERSESKAARAQATSLGDLNPGDAVVHSVHGIGLYGGLTVMTINGVEAEFIAITYRDNDKLYLPVYRVGQIQKYSGPVGAGSLDKLGGTQWTKVKARVRNGLREIAGDLLKLYAKRSQVRRPAFPANDEDFAKFEGAFPYDETDDQLKAVDDITDDMTSTQPMDRLVCGDVGFGKTEVAMRAAFKAIEGQKQVAVLAPTTVLSFQHLETFQKRFKGWPVTIKALNRFVAPAEIRKTIEEIREGKVDIVIGTHRLLSKDIVFKDLGLLIVDEEQRFGVTHKERIKAMKAVVDILTLSATPIPRTLNMSLSGMRDLSLINTPPVDRLPTRTFVTRFDEATIAKAIRAEIQRGGQVFYLHNRVQSIHGVADDIRRLVPEARVRVGHGQMEENELEQVMVAFYHHQVDVLVCTTIIESGIDNPRANTMFIDQAQSLGLAQLYQLRGRVGRSKERAYCYLLIPPNRKLEGDAQERLKVIQENTELGSGIRIAHHDLELRGAGNLLGEDQSGHIDSVGYEMYLELLEQAIGDAKGEPVLEAIEPEINVRIPALIPESYMPDIRIRLSYYNELAQISSPDDIDRIEEGLNDRFGKPPEQVLNLMGLMLIRHHCRELGIRDLSSGPKSISLAFTERTPLPPAKVVQLAQSEKAKYSLTPDMRLIVRLTSVSWPNIYDELIHLAKLC